MRLVLIVFILFASSAFADELPPRISVTGEGQVAATPDMAELTIGVTHEARRADVALGAVADGVAGLFSVLDAAGIDPKDRRTASVSLQPRWDRASSTAAPRITGYVASNRVTIRVRDLDMLGGLITDTVGDGANMLSGLAFVVADPAPLEREARRLAVLEAMEKAALYADTAGVALGDVIAIADAGAVVPGAGPMMAEMALRSDAMPVAEGEVTISASVSMIYAIGN
ncbi:MAG: SIMPL domain-containing protein [Pseudomonadota bacterium]